ncbi:hypothetical protein A3L04_05370 [Thermococcus chitonophagus]|uniref:Type I restriction-modification system, specificity subunit S n=1 Tax=Thermococcus chitonophagus TaxID=54262 RepID=A0A160VSB4_9EURY|nr:restriction endonuclease subunit S [Thermococcus chitonophagus]ASJ16543.1 hypothetical protein A3L04_05370 [Thermococcus chitonophagus]CUX77549.1 Type I restriction-modification system, specificity subunit S [Thermococcus chitonophagus]
MRERPLTEFISKKGEKKESATPKVGVKGPWKLPEGWRWIKLRTIGDIRKETINPQQYPSELFELYSIPAYHSTGKPELKLGKQIKSNKFIVKPGDILFGKLNPHLPKVWIVEPNKGYRQIASTELFPIIVNNKKAITKYVYWYLLSPQVREELVRKVIGTTGSRKRIGKDDILNLKIPLPPLPEQKRIVTKLDELNKRIEEAKRLAREAREEAEKLMASALHEVFSKAEEKGWGWVRLGDVVTRRNETIDPAQNPDLPFVGLEHITPGEVKLSKYSSRVDLRSQKYVFYPGDVLYGKLRPYLDKAVVATIKGMCSTDLLVLTPKEGLMPEYLVTFMHTPQFRELVTQYMRGTNHPRISWKSLQKFKIPLPPLEEQKRIVTYLNSIHERVQRLIKLYKEREKELEQLFPSILDRAFKGKL